jgi:hypothetical protein
MSMEDILWIKDIVESIPTTYANSWLEERIKN